MSDVEQARTAAQAVADRALTKAIEDMCEHGSGRRLLLYFLELCALGVEPYAGENTNATNYMVGSQRPGRMLITRLDQISPQLYPRLLLAGADIRMEDEAVAARAAQGKEIPDEE